MSLVVMMTILLSSGEPPTDLFDGIEQYLPGNPQPTDCPDNEPNIYYHYEEFSCVYRIGHGVVFIYGDGNRITHSFVRVDVGVSIGDVLAQVPDVIRQENLGHILWRWSWESGYMYSRSHSLFYPAYTIHFR